ncbi:hypothetical protein MMC12_003564 [Toensbergia leucococca]|nr:hypothetical protein [Toensbergia leucococca]
MAQHQQIVRFSNHHDISPPNAPPPTHIPIPLTLPQIHQLWLQSLTLYSHLTFESSLQILKRLLRHLQSTPILPAHETSNLWYNIGATRALLGEHFLAREAFAKASSLFPTSPLTHYALGIARFQLQEFRGAGKAFKRCLALFERLGVEEVRYAVWSNERTRAWGVEAEWVLRKERVEWNWRAALFEKNWMAARVERPGGGRWGLNGIPAGVLFGPEGVEWRVEEQAEAREDVQVSAAVAETEEDDMATPKPLPPLPFFPAFGPLPTTTTPATATRHNPSTRSPLFRPPPKPQPRAPSTGPTPTIPLFPHETQTPPQTRPLPTSTPTTTTTSSPLPSHLDYYFTISPSTHTLISPPLPTSTPKPHPSTTTTTPTTPHPQKPPHHYHHRETFQAPRPQRWDSRPLSGGGAEDRYVRAPTPHHHHLTTATSPVSESVYSSREGEGRGLGTTTTAGEGAVGVGLGIGLGEGEVLLPRVFEGFGDRGWGRKVGG